MNRSFRANFKRALTLAAATLTGATASAQRFPKPDFESGYAYPDLTYAVPNEALWTAVDIALLVLMMGFVAWAVLKRRSRGPVTWVSLVSVGYFGFFRSGCVCSVGSIQNVALAFADNTYLIPLSVALFFLLPIVFAFLFGRVFCAGVCPFGALQELVNVKNVRLPRAVTTVLGLVPWIYLIFALLYAATRSSFIVCKFDPFIGIFRLGGDFGMIVFGALLLVASIFIGRPFCRFLCPYGALLGIFSRVAIWKVRITPRPCNNCELCHNACPVDAIRPPYDNKVREARREGVRRLVVYFAVLPLAVVAGALVMRLAAPQLSRVNKEVALHDMVQAWEGSPTDGVMPLEVETYYGQGGTVEAITERYAAVQAEFARYSAVAGALIGLVVGLALVNLSLKRTRREYGIDHAACVACGRCFTYCPQNNPDTETKTEI